MTIKAMGAASALAFALFATSVVAQSAMTLDTFVTQANGIPLNPMSALRPSARRLMGEANTAFTSVGAGIRADRAAGRRPAACPPARLEVNPRQLLAFLNTIPQARRARMTVSDGIRLWLIDRYPCPA